MPSNRHQIRFLSIAEQDLQEITAYIATDNVRAALAFIDKIQIQCQKLGLHPWLGKIPNDERLIQLGYRVLVIENYLLFYKVKGKTILIHRIVHGARNFHDLLK